ncbi:MAG: aminotransferase DegT [Candidatus Marinimicrobia bacterium]|nr:aminotransferase DegT [Candidatus Neomarinimicrobiota bacterium]|tara:strand:+ start:77108 stop:78268 length:1161 start_codon:yes stop_codon:yes gene_type:complete
MNSYLPLSIPCFEGKEWEYVKECIDTSWVSSAGKYVDLFEEKVADYTGSKYAVACMNGTSALHVSLRLAGVQPGDEVIVPTLTFIAPVNAVHYNGAESVFMDVDEYYNVDAEKTIEFIKKETVFKDGFTYNKRTNSRIKAIVPVHVFGNAAWLDELFQVSEERNIVVVEDAAESMGTRYISGKFSGRHTGTIGKFGCLSFNGNKIITSGGGGMILTSDIELAEKAKYLVTQAKDDLVRYIHDEVGYNFRLTNIQAALGVAQLEQLPEFLQRKKDIHRQYVNAVDQIEGLTIVCEPNYAVNNHWMNLLQINSETYGADRRTLISRLDENSIETRPVWGLNHLQKPYREYQSYKIEKAQDMLNNSLCLPSSTNLNEGAIQKVIATLNG